MSLFEKNKKQYQTKNIYFFVYLYKLLLHKQWIRTMNTVNTVQWIPYSEYRTVTSQITINYTDQSQSISFLNSLLIHQIKKKKVTTVKEGLNTRS